jgi:glycosyltransferase involved in cell wall biosynthesis
MRVLHAIHDFLPRHRAGSEIYACELAREQRKEHDVFVLAAEYDPATAHGTLRWREYEGLTVIELVNNWEFAHFSDTYASERINAQLQHVLEATAPDVLHVHNLLNLSFDLPRLAKERGTATVATLHDYTLVCPSGGQRVHVSDAHVCDTIDVERCSRCFNESPFAMQMAAGQVTRRTGGPALGRAGLLLRRLSPRAAAKAVHALDRQDVTPADIRRRLAYARHVFQTVDLFVGPSASIAEEFIALGAPADRVEVSDYGFRPVAHPPSRPRSAERPLQVGFVGTLVWHKGVHVLIEAARGVTGCELHIHGDTSVFPEYVARLRQEAAGAAIVFHNGFERDRSSEIYRDLDVLVVPSLWPENSPLVVHEAFMHAVPVVAARVGGLAGLIRDGVDGLLYDAFSPEALRASLQQLVDDRALLHALSRRAPGVKTIADDAREWDARYQRVIRQPTAAVAPSMS